MNGVSTFEGFLAGGFGGELGGRDASVPAREERGKRRRTREVGRVRHGWWCTGVLVSRFFHSSQQQKLLLWPCLIQKKIKQNLDFSSHQILRYIYIDRVLNININNT